MSRWRFFCSFKYRCKYTNTQMQIHKYTNYEGLVFKVAAKQKLPQLWEGGFEGPLSGWPFTKCSSKYTFLFIICLLYKSPSCLLKCLIIEIYRKVTRPSPGAGSLHTKLQIKTRQRLQDGWTFICFLMTFLDHWLFEMHHYIYTLNCFCPFYHCLFF